MPSTMAEESPMLAQNSRPTGLLPFERLVPPAFLRKRECVCRCVQICCPGASSRCRISICGPRCRRKRTEPLKSETMQGIRAYLQPGKAACSTYPHPLAQRATTSLSLHYHVKPGQREAVLAEIKGV